MKFGIPLYGGWWIQQKKVEGVQQIRGEGLLTLTVEKICLFRWFSSRRVDVLFFSLSLYCPTHCLIYNRHSLDIIGQKETSVGGLSPTRCFTRLSSGRQHIVGEQPLTASHTTALKTPLRQNLPCLTLSLSVVWTWLACTVTHVETQFLQGMVLRGSEAFWRSLACGAPHLAGD